MRRRGGIGDGAISLGSNCADLWKMVVFKRMERFALGEICIYKIPSSLTAGSRGVILPGENQGIIEANTTYRMSSLALSCSSREIPTTRIVFNLGPNYNGSFLFSSTEQKYT
jgi:hypothetical protein